MLFPDTDSLTYEIKSEYVYEELFKHKHLFDFSNFSKDSKCYDSQNEMVVSKMKVVYESKRSKYCDWVLFNKKVIKHKMKRIQSKKHKIGTYEINKISLSCFDNKRFVLDDGIHTLAYFHRELKK